jgi:hypothetical protein
VDGGTDIVNGPTEAERAVELLTEPQNLRAAMFVAAGSSGRRRILQTPPA